MTNFLINYKKTCIVISHDSDFLNCFTDGVINLDVHTHKIEQFVGNYYEVPSAYAGGFKFGTCEAHPAHQLFQKKMYMRFEEV